MSLNKNSAWANRIGWSCAMAVQGILCLGAFADGPAKPAATQPAATQPGVARPELGDIQVADYCTILLAPKLRTNLGCNEAQREALEEMNSKLKARLDNCASFNMPGLNPNMVTPGVISARIRGQLAEYGRKVRDTLTPEQDRRLVDLFNNGTLKTIEVSAVVDTNVPRFGPNAGRVFRTTSYDLSYTHFGENGNDANAPGAVPAALPKATNAPVAPDTGSHKRPTRPGTGAAAPAAVASIAAGDQFAIGRIIHLPSRNAVHHLAATSDGKMIVTCEDQVIRIYDCSTGIPADIAEMDSESFHLGRVRSVAISPDNTLLAVASDDKSVRLYQLGTGAEVPKKLDAQISHDAPLWSVAFSPDGKSIASGADDQSIIWWNVNNARLEEKSRTKLQSIFGVKYLAISSKNILSCTTGSGDVAVIDFSGAQPVTKSTYKIQGSPFQLPMAMSPADGTLLFGGGHNVTLKGTSDRAFTTATKDIKCVAWSLDGKYFATGTDDGHLLLWDTEGKIHLDYTRPTRFNEVTFIANPDHASKDLLIAAANDDCETYLLRVKPEAEKKN